MLQGRGKNVHCVALESQLSTVTINMQKVMKTHL